MKITFLIKTLDIGGAERHVVDLSKELSAKGLSTSVVFCSARDPYLLDELRAANVSVSQLDARTSLGQLRQLARFIRNEQPTIVHAHSPLLKLLARILRSTLNYRLVSTYHNTFPRHRRAIRIVERLSRRVDDVQISCSREVAASMPWATITIPNGIKLPKNQAREADINTLRSRFNIPETIPLFVCVASLSAKKNHKNLLESFAMMLLRGRDARLVLFGDGPLRNELNRQVERLGIGGMVHFAGADPAASRLSAGADIFCLVSWFEGLPLALLEAMGNGLPCIVSKAGQMPYVVQHEKSGIVVDAGDTYSISDAMCRLSSDIDMRMEMGLAASTCVQKEYRFEQMLEKLYKIYQIS